MHRSIQKHSACLLALSSYTNLFHLPGSPWPHLSAQLHLWQQTCQPPAQGRGQEVHSPLFSFFHWDPVDSQQLDDAVQACLA
jgi:hypothetical protein